MLFLLEWIGRKQYRKKIKVYCVYCFISVSLDLFVEGNFISFFCLCDKLSFLHFFYLGLLHLALNIFSFFFKSSKSCVHLCTPFASAICPSMASWRRQFVLRYALANWRFYAGFCLEASSCFQYVQELFHYLFSLTILYSPFSSKTTFRIS